MRKKTVYRISVTLSAIGLSIMFFTEPMVSPAEHEVEELDESMTGEHIKLTGEVVNFNTGSGHLFLDISDGTGEINVVEFDSETWIDTDREVTVQGYVDIYEGDLQIIAESLEQ